MRTLRSSNWPSCLFSFRPIINEYLPIIPCPYLLFNTIKQENGANYLSVCHLMWKLSHIWTECKIHRQYAITSYHECIRLIHSWSYRWKAVLEAKPSVDNQYFTDIKSQSAALAQLSANAYWLQTQRLQRRPQTNKHTHGCYQVHYFSAMHCFAVDNDAFYPYPYHSHPEEIQITLDPRYSASTICSTDL